MKNHLVLKEFVDGVVTQTIIELAKQPHEAEASGFALVVSKHGNSVYLTLFNTSDLQVFGDELAKQPDHLSLDSKLDAALYAIDNPVTGYIRLEKDGECGWVLRNTAAIKGYGPMMHDFALSYVGKTGLLPDRESHTEASRKIWRYYATKRPDVRYYPLSDDNPCAVYQDDPDARFLDAKYMMRNPDTSSMNSLINKGEQLASELEQKTKISRDEVFRRLGSFFFDQMY